jgi:hypothetical protein
MGDIMVKSRILKGTAALVGFLLICHFILYFTTRSLLDNPKKVELVKAQVSTNSYIIQLIGEVTNVTFNLEGSSEEWSGDRGNNGRYCFQIDGIHSNAVFVVDWMARTNVVSISKISLKKKWGKEEEIWILKE